MPIYAYRCESCGFEKDVLQKLSDAPLVQCPQCGKDSFRKQVTAAGFQLKGSGWYVTDFRGGNNAKASPASGEAGAAQSAQSDTGAASGEASGAAASSSGGEGKAAASSSAGQGGSGASSASSSSPTSTTPAASSGSASGAAHAGKS